LLAAILLVPQGAAAQTSDGGPLEIRVDFGTQAKSGALTDSFEVPLYTENERVTTVYPDRGGPFFAVAARFRVWKRLTVGAGVSSFARSGDAAIEAAVPHPFFDNQFRTVEGTASTRRDEVATHVAAGWLLPLARRGELEVSAGPVFVHAHQTFVTGITVDESYPYDTAAFRRADVADASQTSPGIYAGADVRWMFSPHVGAGGLIQFTHARVQAHVADRAVGVDAGGLQGGAGLRLKF
jgi:hypothetical protein